MTSENSFWRAIYMTGLVIGIFSQNKVLENFPDFSRKFGIILEIFKF